MKTYTGFARDGRVLRAKLGWQVPWPRKESARPKGGYNLYDVLEKDLPVRIWLGSPRGMEVRGTIRAPRPVRPVEEVDEWEIVLEEEIPLVPGCPFSFWPADMEPGNPDFFPRGWIVDPPVPEEHESAGAGDP